MLHIANLKRHIKNIFPLRSFGKQTFSVTDQERASFIGHQNNHYCNYL